VLSGGALTAEYDLAELHFHWGEDISEGIIKSTLKNQQYMNLWIFLKSNKKILNKLFKGSEHSINGFFHPMEAHFVHIRRGLSKSKAMKTRDGLAVIGVFIKVFILPTNWITCHLTNRLTN